MTESDGREEARLLAAILASSDDAIISQTLEGVITGWNPGAERLYGHSASQAVGHCVSLLFPPDRSDELDVQLERIARGEWIDHYETSRVRKDGQVIEVSVSTSPIREVTGRVVGAITIGRDVTQYQRTEQDLQRANETLADRVAQLERRDHELTLLSEIGDLLQTCLSHDEAYQVIAQGARQLFPVESGALCVLNESQNLVEAVAEWGDFTPSERAFGPDDCWALRRGKPHLVDNAREGVVCRHLDRPDAGRCLCVPMMAQGRALGVLHLRFGRAEPRDGFLAEAKKQLAVAAAGHFALTLANLNLRESLRQQAVRDPLTGLFNRRYLEETLEREVRRAVRRDRSIGIVMLDLDHFKSFNDTFGHVGGDLLLRELGAYLQSHVRAEDIACRYGGEEFTLILVEASLADTARRADELREGVGQIRAAHGEIALETVSISCGVAAFPDQGPTPETLLRAADAALYRAKSAGRNRVAVAEVVPL
ncbi:MAG TPA: diguanylate cyclase [Chloroflexota bacterium]|nr:diguanylate cyclase [Chloroflexota bacterium]